MYRSSVKHNKKEPLHIIQKLDFTFKICLLLASLLAQLHLYQKTFFSHRVSKVYQNHFPKTPMLHKYR